MTDTTLGPCRLMLGDCLDRMSEIPDGSIDMVMADLPYGTTACKWDTIIPFEALWAHYKRVTKPRAAIVLTASQPFTSALVMSNPKMFRYCLVWDKINRFTGHFSAKRMPLRCHEDLLIFYEKQPIYNPQKRKGVSYKTTRKSKTGHNSIYGKTVLPPGSSDGKAALPGSIVSVKGKFGPNVSVHPTQKPVALMEYLIRTYTDEGETVLDNTMGSGTTGVACVNTGRQFLGIEQLVEYHAIACQRVQDAIAAKAEADRQGDLF